MLDAVEHRGESFTVVRRGRAIGRGVIGMYESDISGAPRLAYGWKNPRGPMSKWSVGKSW